MLAIRDRYLEKAENVARIVESVLAARTGTDPALISRWVMTRTVGGAVWLFAVLDDQRLPKFEPYEQAAHHLSSSLRGMPVILGNHTGLRYGILLSQKPVLPKSVDFPGWKKGTMQLGVDMRGANVKIGYGEISHTLVAGITQYGKSNLLRLMAIQAREEGWQLGLADPDGRTFTKFEKDAALIYPVGKTMDGCVQMIGRVQEMIDERAKLYGQEASSPDSLDDYNAQAEMHIKPVLVVLDEFNGTVQATGGARGAFAQAATQVAWRAAKFGIRLVLAGQDFDKGIVGPVREQMSTRICLRVANDRISDVVLGQRGAERLAVPGRAMTNRWGIVQTYFVPKGMLARTNASGLTDDEQRVAEFIQTKYGGRMTMVALEDFGITQREARRMRSDWNARGLAEIRADQDNALCLTANPTPLPSASPQIAENRDLGGKGDVPTGSCGSYAVGAGSCGRSGSYGNGEVEA